MKKIFIISLTALIVFGCSESTIEISDPQAVTAEIALKKVSGVDALMRSAFRRMHEFNYYGQVQNLAPEALADNLVIANNTGRYTNHVTNAVNTHINLYDRYPTVNDCNLAIKYIDGAAPNTTTEAAAVTTQLKSRLKGEALFLRSLVFHDMVKVYGYDPGMAVNGWNEGIIIRTTPTEGAADANFRSRSTVAEVYTQIIADLIEAVTLLPNEADFGGAVFPAGERIYRPSKAAAQALLARVYLFNKDYVNANATAVLALAATAKTVVSAAGYVNAWNVSNNPESIFELDIRVADWSTVDGVNASMASVTNSLPNGIAAGGAQFAVGGSNELIAAMEIVASTTASGASAGTTLTVADATGIVVGQSVRGTGVGAGAVVTVVAGVTVTVSIANSAAISAGTAVTFGDVRRAVWVANGSRNECRKWRGELGDFRENIPVIRVSELILIAAEARANNSDDAGAQTILNTLRASRGLVATSATGTTLKNLILNERRVEFAFEGHRWFDLKRLGIDIVKPVSLNVSPIVNADFRRLAPIPQAETALNPNLKQNPNY